MVISLLPHAEFGLNDRREDAPHFSFDPIITRADPILFRTTKTTLMMNQN